VIKIQFHKSPDGYHYERTEFKRNVHAIWIVNESHFDYCGCSNIKSIWGFYNSKTKEFHAPVNSKTVGSVVPINKTTPYSAMQLCQTPSWHTV
jgi:hypothetical protein